MVMPSFLEALLAYWGSAVRPKTPLARSIVWLLAFKLVALSVLWVLFFGPGSRRVVDDAVIENSLFQLGHPSADEEIVPLMKIKNDV